MNNKISFSIIMPTYNRAFSIKDAVKSVLKQKYQNFELIIVDDGSTDNTGELIKKNFQRELSSGEIIYHKLAKNQGVSNARNVAFTLVKNEWIAYVDSDNKVAKNHLLEFKNAIEKNQDNFCFYAKIEHRNSGLIVGQIYDYEALTIGNYIDLGVFVHHKKVYDKFGGFDTSLKRLEDWDLILTYTKSFPPIFIDKILLDYNDTSKIVRISNSVDVEENLKKLCKKKSIVANLSIENTQKKKIGLFTKMLCFFIPSKKLRHKLRNRKLKK